MAVKEKQLPQKKKNLIFHAMCIGMRRMNKKKKALWHNDSDVTGIYLNP